MLPTIDIGSIGALVTIAAICKTVVGYIFTAFNWAKNQLVAVATGSKLWATAFFLTIAVVLFGVVNSLLSRVESWFVAQYLPSILFASGNLDFEFNVVNQAIPLHSVFDLGFFIVNTTLGVFVIDHNIIFFRQLVEKFKILVSAWKT